MIYHQKTMWVCTKCSAELETKPKLCPLCKNDRFTQETVERHQDESHIKQKYDDALQQLHDYEEGVPKRTRKSGFEE